MDLDVRWPIGLMFSLFGLLLAGFGLVADPRIYQEHSLGINVNFGWGLVIATSAARRRWCAGTGRRAGRSAVTGRRRDRPRARRCRASWRAGLRSSRRVSHSSAHL